MAGAALAPIQTSPGSAGRSARLASAILNRRKEFTVSPANRRRTMSRASSNADGRVLGLAPIAANRASPQPSPHCMMNGPCCDGGQCPDLLSHQHRVPQWEQEETAGRGLTPLCKKPPEHRRVLIIGRGGHVLIANEQGIEPGAVRRRGSLDHPARSLARIFHVGVIARERDPNSHFVILRTGVNATSAGP